MLAILACSGENEIEADERCHHHDEKKKEAGRAKALVSGAGSLPFRSFLN